MITYGYEYTLSEKNSKTVWQGKDFKTLEEAQEAFQKLVDFWISDFIPPTPKFYEFWKSKAELPNPSKHCFPIRT